MHGTISVTAWTNGNAKASGSGYGLKVQSRAERDNCFLREWGCIQLHIPGVTSPIIVNINKDSF